MKPSKKKKDEKTFNKALFNYFRLKKIRLQTSGAAQKINTTSKPSVK